MAVGEALLKSLPAYGQLFYAAPSQWRGVQVSELGCGEWWRHKSAHRECQLTILIIAVLTAALASVTELPGEQLTAGGAIQDAAHLDRGGKRRTWGEY